MNTNFIGPRPWNLRTEGFFDGDPELGDWFTFAHGGTEVEAEVVFHIGGYYKRGIASLEAVLRTDEGQYFLAREVYPDPVNNEHGYTPPPPAFELAQDSYWLRIKPLTLRGAMLRSFVDVSYDLKADLLAEMAPPVATRDAKSVMVPLTLPLALYRQVLAMGAYDERESFSATVIHSMKGDVEAWLEPAGHNVPNPVEFLAQYERELAAGKHPEVYPPSATKGESMAPLAEPEETPLGQVWGAVYPNDPHRFSFTSEPTAERFGRHIEITLTNDQLQRARGTADAFAMELDRFLAGVVFRRLPGQPGNGEHETGLLADQMAPEHIAFACFDDALTARIERAALAREMTVDAFVGESLADSVDSYEEDMIVHPQTGALLHNDRRSVFDKVSEAMTAPPIGREQEPQWQREMTRKLVEFSAWLLPEQMQDVSYPQAGCDGETNRNFTGVFIPFDGEGIPNLTVDRQAVALGGDLPVIDPGDSLFRLLDKKAVKLIHKYQKNCPWNYSTADVVNGCVISAVQEAFGGFKEAKSVPGLEANRFHDGAWGYLEVHIFNTRQRGVGEKQANTDQWKGGSWWVPRTRTSLTKKDAAVGLAEQVHSAADRPDVALAAAPEPELIVPDPDDDEDEEQTSGEAAGEQKGGK